MKKKSIAAVLVITFLLIFTGCSLISPSVSRTFSYKTERNSYTGIYTLKLYKKSEQETHALSMQEDGSVLIKLDSMIKNGTVDFAIKTEEDKIVYETSGKIISINESVKLSKGLYKIILDYDSPKHGSIKLEMRSEESFDYYRCENGE